ncbi:MAG: SPOR domain-containing protein [Tagaea sp.]
MCAPCAAAFPLWSTKSCDASSRHSVRPRLGFVRCPGRRAVARGRGACARSKPVRRGGAPVGAARPAGQPGGAVLDRHDVRQRGRSAYRRAARRTGVPGGGGARPRARARADGVPAQLAPARAGGGRGWCVQLGTVAAPELAQAEHRRLARRYPDILGDSQAFSAPFTMPDGTGVARVLAGPYDEATARDVCAKLRELNAGCRVVRPDG